ncbi:hypothetical protein SCUP234_10805 [Seiridium cupressi]
MGILLFCTAQEAKSVVPEIMAAEQSQGIDLYVLAQFRSPDQAWQNLIVELKDAFTLTAALTEMAFDVAYPVYFGRKEEFTNKEGVFEVRRAEEAAAGKDQGVV